MEQEKNVQEKIVELITQANLGSIACSYMKSYALIAAIELGIADVIDGHGQPLTASQLATEIPITSSARVSCLERLMGFLVHAGVFAAAAGEDAEEVSYGLTPMSRLLLKDNPHGLLSTLMLMLHPLVITSWGSLASWFRSGEDRTAAFEVKHGEPFWKKASLDPAFNDVFNKAMSNTSKQVMGRIVEGCGDVLFEGVSSIVDVGGGDGTVAALIANAFPQIKCMALDLPHVVASSSPQPNVVVLGGDMFESIPPADAILLKEILHNWDDGKCVKILKRCREAVPKPGGKVIVVDMVRRKWPHPMLDEMQWMIDLHMMLMFDGKERGEEEWKKLFIDAGFSSYKIGITSVRGLSLMEVFP
ncbi:unnamed protein product [Victoria cruziana]